jgi:hypothetical protein
LSLIYDRKLFVRDDRLTEYRKFDFIGSDAT